MLGETMNEIVSTMPAGGRLPATTGLNAEVPSKGLFEAIARGAEANRGTAEIKYHNGLSVPSRLKLLVVLCPIYDAAAKDLGDSSLVRDPSAAKLKASRVGGKMDVYEGVVRKLDAFLRYTNRELSLELLFADKGILLSDPVFCSCSPESRTHDAHRLFHGGDMGDVITAHARVYEEIAKERFRDRGISTRFRSFSQLDGRPVSLMPTVIDTSDLMPDGIMPGSSNFPPKNVGEMRRSIVQHMAHFGVPTPLGDKGEVNNILGTLMKMEGLHVATNISLISTYIAATQSFMDPDLCGPDGMYLNAERFRPLLRIPDMVPALKRLQRIDVQVAP